MWIACGWLKLIGGVICFVSDLNTSYMYGRYFFARDAIFLTWNINFYRCLVNQELALLLWLTRNGIFTIELFAAWVAYNSSKFGWLEGNFRHWESALWPERGSSDCDTSRRTSKIGSNGGTDRSNLHGRFVRPLSPSVFFFFFSHVKYSILPSSLAEKVLKPSCVYMKLRCMPTCNACASSMKGKK